MKYDRTAKKKNQTKLETIRYCEDTGMHKFILQYPKDNRFNSELIRKMRQGKGKGGSELG